MAVLGHKAFETRPRPFPRSTLGERIALHAAVKKVVPSDLPPELRAICERVFGPDYTTTLPFGAVLGTVKVLDNVPTDLRAPALDADQIAMGDWRPGRWSIALGEPEVFAEPVPAKGSQGWWRWPAPRDEDRFPLLAKHLPK